MSTLLTLRSGDLSGVVTVSPDKVYEGETNHNITITFVPKGPIYDSEMLVGIPSPLINAAADAYCSMQQASVGPKSRKGRDH